MNGRQDGLDLGAVSLVLSRQHEALPELGDRLVYGKAGWVGGELEHPAPRLAKIDRVEVVPIDHRRGVEPRLCDQLTHLELHAVVGDTPGHVVDRPRAASAVHEAAYRAHVHDGSRPAVAGGQAPGGAVLMHRTEAEGVHEHPFGGVPLVRPDGHAVKAVDRVLARNAGGRSPGGPRLGAEVADDFEHQPIVVPERDHLPGRPLVPDAVTHQPLDPESERAWQHGERCDGDLSSPVAPGSGAGPGAEGHDTPRRAHVIAVVEMVSLRIVEVHGALDEPEAEQPDVEVEVALGVARDRGDVMNAEHAGHDQYSANASFG